MISFCIISLFILNVYGLQFVSDHSYVNSSCAHTHLFKSVIFVADRCSSLIGFATKVSIVDKNTIRRCTTVSEHCSASASCYSEQIGECDATDETPDKYAIGLDYLPPMIAEGQLPSTTTLTIKQQTFSITGRFKYDSTYSLGDCVFESYGERIVAVAEDLSGYISCFFGENKCSKQQDPSKCQFQYVNVQDKADALGAASSQKYSISAGKSLIGMGKAWPPVGFFTEKATTASSMTQSTTDSGAWTPTTEPVAPAPASTASSATHNDSPATTSSSAAAPHESTSSSAAAAPHESTSSSSSNVPMTTDKHDGKVIANTADTGVLIEFCSSAVISIEKQRWYLRFGRVVVMDKLIGTRWQMSSGMDEHGVVTLSVDDTLRKVAATCDDDSTFAAVTPVQFTEKVAEPTVLLADIFKTTPCPTADHNDRTDADLRTVLPLGECMSRLLFRSFSKKVQLAEVCTFDTNDDCHAFLALDAAKPHSVCASLKLDVCDTTVDKIGDVSTQYRQVLPASDAEIKSNFWLYVAVGGGACCCCYLLCALVGFFAMKKKKKNNGTDFTRV